MTATELQTLIVTALARKAGNPRQWRRVVGAVKVYSMSTHPHCNWSVSPAGTAREVAMVEHLLDTLRLRHPIVGQ